MRHIPPTSRRVFLRELSRTSLAISAATSMMACPTLGQDSTAISDPNRIDTASRIATGTQGVVATVNPLASQAAMQAFERGGNAIDAAVAASLMLSVVDGHNSGLGGGCLALIHRADGTVIALDGLTGDQRFFMGEAQVWRSLMRDEALKQRLATDPHSPAKYRVNNVVRNVDAWYAAFNVQPGDALYLKPEDRVRIW